jgi:hypothetical protein
MGSVRGLCLCGSRPVERVLLPMPWSLGEAPSLWDPGNTLRCLIIPEGALWLDYLSASVSYLISVDLISTVTYLGVFLHTYTVPFVPWT